MVVVVGAVVRCRACLSAVVAVLLRACCCCVRQSNQSTSCLHAVVGYRTFALLQPFGETAEDSQRLEFAPTARVAVQIQIQTQTRRQGRTLTVTIGVAWVLTYVNTQTHLVFYFCLCWVFYLFCVYLHVVVRF